MATRQAPEKKLLKYVLDAIEDTRGGDCHVLDLTQMSSYADYLILATAQNNRQLQTMSDRIRELAKSNCLIYPFGVEGYEQAEWILVDFGSIVCHLFSEEARAQYRLEDMWPRIKPLSLDEARALLKKASAKSPAKKAVKKAPAKPKVIRRKKKAAS